MNRTLPVYYFFVAAIALTAYFAGIANHSLWLDEAYSVLTSGCLPADIIAKAASDRHPPLYYLLLHFWMKIFGTGPVAVRSLSAFFALLLLAGTVALAHVLFDSKTALISGLLTALSPFIVWYAGEARMYTMVGAFSVLAVFFFWLLLTAPDRKNMVLYILFMTLAVYTHYFSLFVLVSLFLYGLFEKKAAGRKKGLTASVIVLILFLPWFTNFIEHLLEGIPWGSKWVPVMVPVTFFHFSLGEAAKEIFRSSLILRGFFFWSFFLAAIAGFIELIKEKKVRSFLLLYLFGPVVMALMLSLKTYAYLPKYLIVIAPAYYIILALAFRRATPFSSLTMLLTCVLFSMALSLNQFYTRTDMKGYWREATSGILFLLFLEPARTLYFFPNYYDQPFRYYAREAGRTDFSIRWLKPGKRSSVESIITELGSILERTKIIAVLVRDRSLDTARLALEIEKNFFVRSRFDFPDITVMELESFQVARAPDSSTE